MENKVRRHEMWSRPAVAIQIRLFFLGMNTQIKQRIFNGSPLNSAFLPHFTSQSTEPDPRQFSSILIFFFSFFYYEMRERRAVDGQFAYIT